MPPGIYVRPTSEQRFWLRVMKTPRCWLWLGRPTMYGYGRLRVDGRDTFAHRFAYELLVGPIPDGLTIDHLCRVKTCVNPAHLEPVTIGENVLRGETLPAANLKKTHCPQGHPYDEKNTKVVKTGRQCKTCDYARGKLFKPKWRARRRALGLPYV